MSDENKPAPNVFLKIGSVGIAITGLLMLILQVVAGASVSLTAPFLMPWIMVVMIGFSYRKK